MARFISLVDYTYRLRRGYDPRNDTQKIRNFYLCAQCQPSVQKPAWIQVYFIYTP